MTAQNDTPESRIDLRRVDLNLLIIFEAIYTSGSVSRAAERLKMSQPTVSNALNRLRSQFDDRLFVRAERGVRPTPTADMVAGPVTQALDTLRGGLQVETEFDIATAHRVFRLLLHDYNVPLILPPLVEKLNRPDSTCSVEVVTPNWDKPQEGLSNGTADVLIDVYPQETPGVIFEPIAEARPVYIARVDHPFIKETLTRDLFELCGHAVWKNQMRLHVPQLLMGEELNRRVVCILPNAGDLAATVSTTDLIAVVPERYARLVAPTYGLRILPTPFAYPPLKLFLGWPETMENDPGYRWLRQSIREIFA